MVVPCIWRVVDQRAYALEMPVQWLVLLGRCAYRRVLLPRAAVALYHWQVGQVVMAVVMSVLLQAADQQLVVAVCVCLLVLVNVKAAVCALWPVVI